MNPFRIGKMARALAALCVLFLAAVGLWPSFGTEKSVETAVILGERDGVRLTRGAQQTSGRAVTFPRAHWLQGTLMLASPQHPLPGDYPAPEARAVQAIAGNFLPLCGDVALRSEVIYAFCRMQLDYPLNGQACLVQGAVSYAQQEATRRGAFLRYAAVCSLPDAISQSAAAVPGGNESEHQTGWAADIELTGPLNLGESNPLCRNAAGRWLAENMWRYGFIQRYAPSGGDEGNCENVHLRYVGECHAAAMHALGLGLEDYLLFLHAETRLTLSVDGEPRAVIRCVPEQETITFSVPEGAAPEISGDNMGWVVAVIPV